MNSGALDRHPALPHAGYLIEEIPRHLTLMERPDAFGGDFEVGRQFGRRLVARGCQLRRAHFEARWNVVTHLGADLSQRVVAVGPHALDDLRDEVPRAQRLAKDLRRALARRLVDHGQLAVPGDQLPAHGVGAVNHANTHG